MTDNKQTVSVLNDLIETCKDGEAGRIAECKRGKVGRSGKNGPQKLSNL